MSVWLPLAQLAASSVVYGSCKGIDQLVVHGAASRCVSYVWFTQQIHQLYMPHLSDKLVISHVNHPVLLHVIILYLVQHYINAFI